MAGTKRPETRGSAASQGCLELAILAALWSGKLYGLEILRRLETDSNLIVSEGTVYPLLRPVEGARAGAQRVGLARCRTSAGNTMRSLRPENIEPSIWQGRGRGSRRA